MDASQISVENVAAVIGVGLAAAWLAAKKYLAERKAPPVDEAKDLALLAGSITDMRPVRDMAVDLKRLADAAVRIADAAEHSAEEDEIERRAKARAAEMVATEASRRRPQR